MKIYDLIIIGSGVAGIMAAHITAKKGLSILILERGKDLAKRRDLISGWFGRGLFDDFKDEKGIKEVIKIKKDFTSQHLFALSLYEQLKAKTDIIFNSEVLGVDKDGDFFLVNTVKNSFKCKRCLIATGKYSFEFINTLCKKLEIETKKEIKVGVRVELPTNRIKDTNLTDYKNNGFVGEWEENVLSSIGYISDKVSHKSNFLIGIEIDKRLEDVLNEVKVINVLANDRIKIEKATEFMNGKSLMKNLEIFDKLRNEIEKTISSIIGWSILYIPEIMIKGMLPENLVPGIYGAGECLNSVNNITQAAVSGLAVGKTIAKEMKND